LPVILPADNLIEDMNKSSSSSSSSKGNSAAAKGDIVSDDKTSATSKAQQRSNLKRGEVTVRTRFVPLFLGITPDITNKQHSSTTHLFFPFPAGTARRSRTWTQQLRRGKGKLSSLLKACQDLNIATSAEAATSTASKRQAWNGAFTGTRHKEYTDSVVLTT